MGHWLKTICRTVYQQWALFNGAVLFYTCVPLPPRWPVQFGLISRLAPIIGLGMAGLLIGLDVLLGVWLPLFLRSALVVLMGVWLTGGLHLDGAMDTADGLAVQDRQRCLEVMADSRTGAFGVIVAIAILLLKTAALATVLHHRWFILLSAAAWGRWGQQWAIGSYPYLKLEGKGAFHKQAIPSRWYTLPCALGLMVATILTARLAWIPGSYGVGAVVFGVLSSWIVAGWLNHKLGGHTGDTYGAVVEWVEVTVMVALAGVSQG